MASVYEKFLIEVQKPTRYIGNEWNLPPVNRQAPLRVVLLFPDTYEVGMSNLGIQILFHILAQQPGILVDRCFTPWIDMERLLRARQLPLCGLQTGLPLSEFHIIGVTLQYELNYTNVLTMLDLGGVPLHAAERTNRDPLVIGGGPAVLNPEPMAEFFDGFLLGDGEEAIVEIAAAVARVREQTNDREAQIRELAAISGFYVPTFFQVAYSNDGVVESITPGPQQSGDYIPKRLVRNLDAALFPTSPLVSLSNIVHDRVTIEVSRGCQHICRFCPASVTSKPVRNRSAANVKRLSIDSLTNTGHSELSLSAFNITDYPELLPLVGELMQWCAPRRVSLAIPSFRPGGLTPELIGWIQTVRKTGFTMAPEAGSSRLRAVINKNITDEQLFANARDAFSLGWNLLKLYFMIGLPGETESDIGDLIELCKKLLAIGRASTTRPVSLNLSISPFVPKPHTTFQWFPQESLDSLEDKVARLRRQAPHKAVRIKASEPRVSRLEAALSNGNRLISRVIETAWRLGSRFEGWTETFEPDLWEEAFARCGMTIDGFASRHKALTEVLPWSHLTSPAHKRYLVEDCERVKRLLELPAPAAEPIDIKLLMAEKPVIPAAVGQGARLIARPPVQVIRAVYERLGTTRFLSHLDWMRLLEQALRRAQAPVAFSSGFNPHPRIAYCQPLPVGAASMGELIDVWLVRRISADSFIDGMNQQLPPEVRFTRARILPLTAPGIYQSIQAIAYRVVVPEEVRESWRGQSIDLWQRLQQWFGEQEAAVKTSPDGAGRYLVPLQLSAADKPAIEVEVLIVQGSPTTIRPLEVIGRAGGFEGAETKKLNLMRLAFFSDKEGKNPVL